METAILAPRTTAAATASAVRRLSWPGKAAITGTSRRRLNRPISGGSWSRAFMHPTLLVLRTCRQRTGQRALTRSSHDPGQPPKPRTGGEYLAGLSRCDQESFCRTLLLGQYGEQKGVVDNDHARESGRSALSQIGVSCDGILCGLLVGAGGQVFTDGGANGLGDVGRHFADAGRPKFARLRRGSSGSLCCCLQIPGGNCHD